MELICRYSTFYRLLFLITRGLNSCLNQKGDPLDRLTRPQAEQTWLFSSLEIHSKQTNELMANRR